MLPDVTNVEKTFEDITSVRQARNAVELAKAKVQGRASDASLADKDFNLKGLQLVARVYPVWSTAIEAAEGKTGDAIASGFGDAATILGFGLGVRLAQVEKLSRGLKFGLIATASIDVGVAGYKGFKGVEDLTEGKGWEAIAHFGEAGVRLLGITPNILAYRAVRENAKAFDAARAVAAREAAEAARLAPTAGKTKLDLMGGPKSSRPRMD